MAITYCFMNNNAPMKSLSKVRHLKQARVLDHVYSKRKNMSILKELIVELIVQLRLSPETIQQSKNSSRIACLFND